MDIQEIPAGIPFRDSLGLPRATGPTLILIDRLADLRARGPEETLRLAGARCATAAAAMRAYLESHLASPDDHPFALGLAHPQGLRLGYIAVHDTAGAERHLARLHGGPDHGIDPRTAVHLIRGHEEGHIIEPADHLQRLRDGHLQHRAEAFCDGHGAGQALAATHDRGSVSDFAALRDRLAAADLARGRLRAGLIYDLGAVNRAALAAAPPDAGIAGALGTASAAMAGAMDVDAYERRLAALQRDRLERQGDNCISVIDERTARIRLDLVADKRLDAAEVARQVRAQIHSLHRIVHAPRGDLPGGAVALEGHRLALRQVADLRAEADAARAATRHRPDRTPER